jgi:phosphate/phosphite/phosphonate ABC transporter binding protein
MERSRIVRDSGDGLLRSDGPMRIRFLSIIYILLSITASAKDNLTLGVNESTTAGQMAAEMAGIVAHLNTSQAIAVKLKVYPNHDALYAALRTSEVDVALLGAVKYVEAHDEFGAIPVVSEGRASTSGIAVPANSPIRKVEELRAKRLGFGYKDSTTTHLIPLLLLSKHGLKESDVEAKFGGHQPQKIVDDMLAGKYDACAVSDVTYAQNKSRLRLLDNSDPYPGPPIVVRQDMNPKLRDELQKMFVSYKPAPDQASQRFAKGAMAVTNEDYNRIRFLCKVLFNKTYK